MTVATTDGATDRRPIAANRSVNNAPEQLVTLSAQERVDRRRRERLVAEPGYRIQQVQLLRSSAQRHVSNYRKSTCSDGRHAADGHRLTHQSPSLLLEVSVQVDADRTR
jgi:hypothetical protein